MMREILEKLDISIHALREEGDGSLIFSFSAFHVFLSTPSARRATPSSYASSFVR